MGVSLLFPGQAAQFVGMGKAASIASERSKKILENSDEILGYKLSEIMASGPEEKLKGDYIYTTSCFCSFLYDITRAC